MATVLVGNKQTPWFRFGIGVFQGCTVSTILFNVAFNTSFEHLSVLEDECAYNFFPKAGKPFIRTFITGYADDLGIVTGTHGNRDAFVNNERALKRLQDWLEWTKSMKAKPKKCIASGLKHGKPIDPKLKVWESQGQWFPKFLADENFKFLGKGLLADVSSRWAKIAVKKKFSEYTKLIDSTLLTGIQKIWIWEHMAMNKVSWDFLIHDFPPSFVEKELQPIQTRYLKKWSHLAKPAEPSVFYRSHEHAGMGLTEATVLHKVQRVIRRHLLATSKDPCVRQIHEQFADHQKARAKTGTNEWKECQELEKLRAEVKMGKIAGQSSEGAGIGFGRRRRLRPLDSRKAERQEILRVFKEIAEEERLVKIMSKPLIASDDHPSEKKGNFFCDWLKWKNASAADLRWNHLLQQQDSYLSVVLNSTQDSLPTPSRLKCWAQQSAGDGRCPLGCREAGTLKHILCGCQRAIKEPHSRITWRHDSVLLAIYRGVLDRLEEAGNARKETKEEGPVTEHVFKSECGKTQRMPHVTVPQISVHYEKDVFMRADDWKVQFDVDLEGGSVKNRPFPPEVGNPGGVGSRPDGIIWSMKSKTVIWIELTSPWEENLQKNNMLKTKRYNQLAIDLREGKYFGVKWTVLPLYVEVGARGALHELSWGRLCRTLGFTGKARKQLAHAMQNAAVYCSHYIFLCRFFKTWEVQPLLDTWRKSD